MFHLPALPSWDALHPLIIHFPIALLMIVPLFIVLGILLAPSKGRVYLTAALILLLAGTVGLYFAVGTGEAAGQLAERTPGVERVLEAHESLAERTRAVFTVLSILFLALLAAPRLLKWQDTRLTTMILPLAFLVLYGGGILLLINTAHNGGRLVHEFGVHAIVASSPAGGGAAAPSGPADKEQEKD